MGAPAPLSLIGRVSLLSPLIGRSMGVRVMDTSWVSRRGSSVVRKTSSTPSSVQPPAPPADALAPELSAEPSPTPTPPPASSDRAR